MMCIDSNKNVLSVLSEGGHGEFQVESTDNYLESKDNAAHSWAAFFCLNGCTRNLQQPAQGG